MENLSRKYGFLCRVPDFERKPQRKKTEDEQSPHTHAVLKDVSCACALTRFRLCTRYSARSGFKMAKRKHAGEKSTEPGVVKKGKREQTFIAKYSEQWEFIKEGKIPSYAACRICDCEFSGQAAQTISGRRWRPGKFLCVPDFHQECPGKLN